ncbi:MAG: tetratricopeptide repeat protein [bacterium]
MFLLTKSAALLFLVLHAAPVSSETGSFNDDLSDGIHLFEAGKLDAAKEIFENFLEENPENAEAYYYLGRTLFRKNDLKKAEKNFKTAVKLVPNSSLYHTWLGHTYGNRINNVGFFKKMGMAKNIKKHYRIALDLDENNIDALDGIITFHTEAPGIAGGSKDKAKEYAAKLKKLDKYLGYSAFGRIYEKEKKYDLAEAEYKSAITEFPEKINIRFRLGYFYQRREKFDEAFDVFEKMLADSSNNLAALYQIGRTGALSGQNLDRAEECFKQYVQHPEEANPSKASAHWRLGMVYEHKQQKDLAREHYRMALKLEPDHKQAKKALKKLQ